MGTILVKGYLAQTWGSKTGVFKGRLLNLSTNIYIRLCLYLLISLNTFPTATALLQSQTTGQTLSEPKMKLQQNVCRSHKFNGGFSLVFFLHAWFIAELGTFWSRTTSSWSFARLVFLMLLTLFDPYLMLIPLNCLLNTNSWIIASY